MNNCFGRQISLGLAVKWGVVSYYLNLSEICIFCIAQECSSRPHGSKHAKKDNQAAIHGPCFKRQIIELNQKWNSLDACMVLGIQGVWEMKEAWKDKTSAASAVL